MLRAMPPEIKAMMDDYDDDMMNSFADEL